MKVSIAIPVFNAEKSLDRCVKSVIEQSYKNIEIILVNDGSTDHSGELCDRYSLIDNRVNIVHQRNLGASSARNAAIDRSSGKYICFVDADDYIGKDYVKIMVDELASSEAQLSICSYWIDDASEKMLPGSGQRKIYNSKNGIINMLLTSNIDTCVCCKLVPLEIAKRVKFKEDQIIAEDLLFYYSVFKEISKAVYIDQKEYHYVQNQNSSINSVSPDKIKNLSIFEDLLTLESDQDIREAIVSKYLSTCFHFLALVNRKKDYKSYQCLKNNIKKYRGSVLISKHSSMKVKFACAISYGSFELVNLLQKVGRGKRCNQVR